MVEYNLRTILGHIYGTSSLWHLGSRFICTRDLRALIPWWIVGLSLQQTKNWARFFYSCRWVVNTIVENYSKCLIWIFQWWQFPPFCPKVMICLVTLFWPPSLDFPKCDYFCDIIETRWTRFGQLKATRRGRRGDALTQVNAWTATHTICRRSFFPFPSF